MSELKRDNNFTKQQLRGIELAVKSASKKFPFIKGWKFSKDFKNYSAHLYIDLFVDYVEFAKFYNSDIHYAYQSRTTLPRTSIPHTFLKDAPVSGFQTEEWNEYFEKAYSENQKIKNYLEKIYESLPEEFSIFYPTKRYYPEEKIEGIKCHLSISDYVDIKDSL
jgi:hypothetical protein